MGEWQSSRESSGTREPATDSSEAERPRPRMETKEANQRVSKGANWSRTVTLACGPLDRIRRMGLARFLKRTGLGKVVAIAETDASERAGTVQIPGGRWSGRIVGEFRVATGMAPLFELPKPLDGSALVTAVANGETRPIASERDGIVQLGVDPLLVAGHALSGDLETLWADPALRESLAMVPLVDRYEDFLLFCVQKAAAGAGVSLPDPPSWPGGAPYALCLTHDVDRTSKTFQYATHALRGLREGSLREAVYHLTSWTRSGEPYWAFDSVRELESVFGARSTYFFLHEDARPRPLAFRSRILSWGSCRLDDPRVRRMVMKLQEEGHEIGLHSSISAAEDIGRLRREVKALRELVNPLGVRQHYLYIEPKEIWRRFAEVGFAYDSSVGFRDRPGFRSGTALPYPLAAGDLMDIIEIPLVLMDGTLPRDMDKAWALCRRLLAIVRAEGGVATLLFHQRYFNEREFPGYKALYRRILEQARADEAWIARGRDVWDAWRNR